MANPKTVALVDPNGNDFNATTPAEVNNLVYGAGYSLKTKGQTVDQALALLAESGPVAEALEAQQAGPNELGAAAAKK